MLGSTHARRGGHETSFGGNEAGTCDGSAGTGTRVQSGGHSNAALAREESAVKIEIIKTETELFIKLNGITHFRIARREIIGYQSWLFTKDYLVPHFEIEFYTRCGNNVILDYDRKDIWEDILSELDKVIFLYDEWKS